jgi:uncharacterized protein YukE
MNSLSVSPATLHASGWDVSDAGLGSRFASSGHESDLQAHQQGWVGLSGAALAELRHRWQDANAALHRDVDSLADGMRSAADGFATSERHAADALRAVPGEDGR